MLTSPRPKMSIDRQYHINEELIFESDIAQIVHSRHKIFPYPLQAPSQSNEDVILHLRLDSWIDVLTEDSLVKLIDDFEFISLEIHGAYCAYYTTEKIQLISQFVSPKLVSIQFIDCHDFSWRDHVKPLLSTAYKIEIINIPRNYWLDYTVAVSGNDKSPKSVVSDSSAWVFEQLTNKFSKSLRCLILENSKITNDTLLMIGKLRYDSL